MTSTTHSRDIFGLTVLKNSHPDIRRLKQQYPAARLHGNKLWAAGVLLMDYLTEFPPPAACRILEIGCGWGLTGLYCAQQFDAEVVGLDADDSVLPFMEHHAQLNQIASNTVQMTFEQVTVEQLSAFDMVIASDICFWDEMVEPLADFIERAAEAGIERLVIADPGRPSFRALAEHITETYPCRYSDWSTPAPHNLWGLVLDLGDAPE